MTVLTPANAFPNLPFPQHYATTTVARNFNGTSDLIDTTTIAFSNTAAQTVSCWVNLSSLSNAYTAIVSAVITSGTNTGSGRQIFVKSNGKLAVYLALQTGSVSENYDGTGSHTLVTGTWYNLVWTYDSVAGLVGYVNGVQDATVAANGTIYALTSFATQQFGNDANTSGRKLSGSLSDVAIWNVALTSAQVLALAGGARANTVLPGSLIGYWPIIGSSPERDFVGSDVGFLTGTTVVSGPPGLPPVIFTPVQSFLYPGAVLPNPNPPPPSVLSIANAFPNLAFPQHLSGQTNTVRDFLYPGAVQPAVQAGLTLWAQSCM